MPGYIAKPLHNFQHSTHKIPHNPPHEWTAPAYGSIVQYVQTEPDLQTLDPVGTQRFQSIAGTFLYYSRAVNPTILPVLNKIFTQQSKPTPHTITKFNYLLDYAATQPDSVI